MISQLRRGLKLESTILLSSILPLVLVAVPKQAQMGTVPEARTFNDDLERRYSRNRDGKASLYVLLHIRYGLARFVYIVGVLYYY